MNKRLIVPAFIVVIFVVAAGFLAARKGAEHPDETGSTQSAVPAVTQKQQQTDPGLPVATGSAQLPAPVHPENDSKSKARFSSGEEAEGVDTQVFEIIYDGTAYTPSAISIKAGDIIVFKNKSQQAFWPASSPHPLHTDYPEFDPKRPVALGQTYEFKFLKVGSWKFHDHLNSAARGVVTVMP